MKDFNDKYQMIKILNKGRVGTIFEVKDKTNGFHYVLKLIINKLSSFYEKEIEVMNNKNLKSKYIIELKDNFYDKTNEAYCIVMELCDGDLRQILKKYKPKGLPLNMINKIFSQLNEALKVMIDNDYTHRDLKPENILIKYTDEKKNDFDIKLTDFGFSTDEVHSTIDYHSYAGTRNYMAPEVEKGEYNKQCDLWSLGVLLYELYTNKYIFNTDNDRLNGKIAKETDNEMINKLIRKLIQVDIDKRINWEEYFNDDFFKSKNIVNNNKNIKNNNNNKQIIKIKIEVKKNNEEIKIYNGNEDIDEKNIKLFIENKEIEFKKVINNLKEGNYNINIEINQNITNCKEMFSDCNKIKEINFTNFDTKNVTDMSKMFLDCESLNNLNITKFDTKNVIDMSEMFWRCESLNNLNVSNFDTKKVTNMSLMFSFCKSLKELNVTKFDTKNVTNMYGMFQGCSSLKDLNLNNFDTKKVTDMKYMFDECKFKYDKIKFKSA